MIKLVAFDWNGTLIADSKICWQACLPEFKMAGVKKPISFHRWQNTFTIPYIECLVKNGANRQFCIKNGNKISEAFHNLYELKAARCRTRAGVKEVLKWLGKQKIKAMIYSNHTQIGIDFQLKRLGIHKHLDIVQANNERKTALHLRGKGQRLSEYIKKIKLKPYEVISVGDSEEEIEIGKTYGYHTVAITGGYNSTSRLKKHKPDFLIHNMLELKKIIKKLSAPSFPSPRVGRD